MYDEAVLSAGGVPVSTRALAASSLQWDTLVSQKGIVELLCRFSKHRYSF